VVRVDLSDRGAMMGIGSAMMVSLGAIPASAPTGVITFEATNTGFLDHELLVMPAPAGGVGTRPVGVTGQIDESQSLGEASASCRAGVGSGIAPGATGWMTVSLKPGLYELLCDVPWHYARGMVTGFQVS